MSVRNFSSKLLHWSQNGYFYLTPLTHADVWDLQGKLFLTKMIIGMPFI